MIIVSFWGVWYSWPISTIPPIISSPKWGGLLDLELGTICWPSPLFFVTNSTLAFVTLVEFEHIYWCSCFALVA
jgi:hypothetical protein